jgi:hypothetical protein
MNADVLDVSSVPRVMITSSSSVNVSSTVVGMNPVTTHSQLHFVSEEIQASSRISPVSRNVRSINAKHIRGGANPLPTNTEARGADFSG